jgi:hypothetical protein
MHVGESNVSDAQCVLESSKLLYYQKGCAEIKVWEPLFRNQMLKE